MESLSFSFPEYLFAGILFVLFLVQTLYLVFYNRLSSFIRRKNIYEEEIPPVSSYPPVSIVIAAHNQSTLLQQNLPYIMGQEYPEFEVIIVNDTSTDDTDNVLASLKTKYPNLYYTFIPNSSRNPSHKKLSLSLGIKACKNEWIVFTEPDCIPSSPLWLQRMACNFTPDTEIVLGYSRYPKEKGYFYSKIRLLNLFDQARFLLFAAIGKPYMGYGRNLAYRKSLFFKHNGYSGYLNRKRGEDDLFLNQVACKENTQVELSPESIIEISPLTTPRLWRYEQRERKETYRLLKGSQPSFWRMEAIFRILFLLTSNAVLVYGLLAQQWLLVALACLFILIRFILFLSFTHKICKLLQEPRFKTLLFFFTWIQFIHSLKSYKNHPSKN